MIIEVGRIPPEGMAFVGEEPPVVLDIQDEGNMRIDGPVRYDLKAYVASKELIVNGTLTVDMSFRCSKCGEFFSLHVIDSSFQCARELSDMNESVDLTADIRESMILAFPAYPVCRLDCRGLCPLCGANLNEDECKCKPSEDFRWNVLNNLNSRP